MLAFLRFALPFLVMSIHMPTGAQQAPLIGFLSGSTRDENLYLVDAFRQGLRQIGFIEGTNVLIEYRWAENRRDRVQQLADDLIARKASVLATAGGPEREASSRPRSRSSPFSAATQ